MTLDVRRITDAQDVAHFPLRPLDAEECRAGGLTPSEALTLSVERSDECWLLTRYGRMVACWGYRTRSILGNTVDVWMLSGGGVAGMELTFARESRRLMSDLLTRYSTLVAWVWIGHTVTVRWLEWLGFEKGPTQDDFAWFVKERT